MKRHSILILMIGLWVVPLFAANRVSPDATGWVPLFDGQSLKGWKASEHTGSFRVEDSQIIADGARSHLFYTGNANGADFKNFELKAKVMTKPGANSGIYFHTQYQEKGWPEKGFEVQINNTHRGEGNYRELKKTGSLYGVRNQYKSIVKDNEWFEMHIIVQSRRIRILVDQTLLVDYTEPNIPVQEGEYRGRTLSHGTFALQCHDAGSKAFFKDIRVKSLPDEITPETSGVPTVDERYLQILRLQRDNFPVVDLHVHLKGGLTLDEALANSRRGGIFYGIAPNCGLGFDITNDTGIDRFLAGVKGQPIFLGMQAEGREWVRLFSKEAVARFDYVFTDAMTFTDDNGKRMRLWIKDEVEIKDKQAFMDMYVQRILAVLNNEPIDIYVNPTFLPECIAKEYEGLWTPERMQKVIDAAKRNNVAIEINSRFRLPSAPFIKMAKQAGVKFSMGTNNADRELGLMDYGLEMVKECGLTYSDMFLPKPDGQKPIQLKGFRASAQ